MEKGLFKERFEYIIGFLALVISLSNFKAELEKVIVNLAFAKFNLSEYFFILILASIAALHVYLVPQFIKSEKTKKVIAAIAFGIFGLIVFSPMILIVLHFLVKVFLLINFAYIKELSGLFSVFLTSLSVTYIVKAYLDYHRNKVFKKYYKEEEMSEEEREAYRANLNKIFKEAAKLYEIKTQMEDLQGTIVKSHMDLEEKKREEKKTNKIP